jgi:Fibronectin type III domain
VVVTWDAPAYDGGAPVTGYEIFRARSSGAEKLYRTVTCTSSRCTYTNTHARTDIMFFYTVEAVNAAGPGPASGEVFARAR